MRLISHQWTVVLSCRQKLSVIICSLLTDLRLKRTLIWNQPMRLISHQWTVVPSCRQKPSVIICSLLKGLQLKETLIWNQAMVCLCVCVLL
ncbi:hypothetical protein DPMN_046069 [Dreissena polymorpha]|uniref:Uncharacterized protein n=1 Tax=Dreissena polymorpha TaxID=45954 RepID=A0A9D4I0I6_DREPO|nr:hypothetical protein DPMN_046069 [Dreissena polymorpha]